MSNVCPAMGKMVKQRWSDLLKATLISVGSPRWIAVGSPDDRRIIATHELAEKDTRRTAAKRARVDAFGQLVRDYDPERRPDYREPNWRRDLRSWLDKKVAAQPNKIWRVLTAVRRNWCIGFAQVGYIQHATAVIDAIVGSAQSPHSKYIASLLTYAIFPPSFAYHEVVPPPDETKAQTEARVRSGLEVLDHRLTLNMLAAPDADPGDAGLGSLMAYELSVPRDLVTHRVEKSPLTELLVVIDGARVTLWGDELIPSKVDIAQINSFELRAIARLVDPEEISLLDSRDVYTWPPRIIMSTCASLAKAALERLDLPNVYDPRTLQEVLREMRGIA